MRSKSNACCSFLHKQLDTRKTTITILDKEYFRLQNNIFLHNLCHWLSIFFNDEQEPSCCSQKKKSVPFHGLFWFRFVVVISFSSPARMQSRNYHLQPRHYSTDLYRLGGFSTWMWSTTGPTWPKSFDIPILDSNNLFQGIDADSWS